MKTSKRQISEVNKLIAATKGSQKKDRDFCLSP